MIAAAVALSGAVIAVFPVVAQLKEIRTQTQLQSRETLKQMIESANKMEEIIVNIDKKFFSLAFFDGSGKRQGGFYNENGNNDQGNVLFSKESIGETRQFFDFNFSRRMLADIKGDIDRLYEAKGFNELGEAVEREILLRVDVYRKVNKLIIQHTSAGGEGKFDFYRIDGVDASVNTVRAELVSITAEVTSPVSEERISEVFSRARQPIRNKISESYRSMLE